MRRASETLLTSDAPAGGRARARRGCRARLASRLVLVATVSLALTLLATPASSAPLFALPLAGDPGPSTWYVAQWYGPTVWAYRNWQDLYSQGQGYHFGVDFATPCGTPVHAIGDGVVFAIDGPYGAAPHNVVIDHQDGYLSLYGHLRQRSSFLRVGQRVARGDVIGYSGDPASANCDRAPHLHLEIRRTGMSVAVDPVPLIAADWHLLTIGADTEGQRFAFDYANPSASLAPDDQPDTHFGGPVLTRSGVIWPPR